MSSQTGRSPQAGGVAPPWPEGAVVLRPLGPADYSRLAAWVDSPELLAHWSGSELEHPLDQAQLARLFARDPGSPTRRLAFKAVERERGEVVGHGELGRIMPSDRTGALNRILVRSDRRGRGLGRAVVEALAGKAFAELGLHRLEVRVFERNEAAVELYRRCGFVLEGVLREAARVGDHHESLLVMGMLADEWRARDEGRTP